MRYLSSILATVFWSLAMVKFGIQMYIHPMAPMGEMVVMIFSLVFLALIWVAQYSDGQKSYAAELTPRIISQNKIFPLCGFAIQYVFVLLYLVAWDNPSPLTATFLKLVLPKGFFVPMLIEMILLGVVAALWMGNNSANSATETMQVDIDNSRSRQQSMQAQVALLEARINPSDEEALKVSHLIDGKLESLPLHPDGRTAVFYNQAMQQIQRLLQSPVSPTADELISLKRTLDRIR